MKLLFLLLLLPGITFSQNYKSKADKVLNSSFSNGPGCAALVSVNGNAEYSHCTGKANIELDVPIKLEHKFRIGSITKQFTAIAILILEERGQLSVNDPIHKYLPDFPKKKHTITIEHLLTHTSGLKSYTEPDIMNEDFMRVYHHPDSLANSFSGHPLAFEPGSEFSYCNSGYHLLGLIIERVSGMSYSAFLKKEIFDVAGMKDSRTDSNKEIIKDRISGYDPFVGPVNAQYIDMSIPYSAGNILSTVSDLNLWYKALFSYKIVKKETLMRAHTSFKLSNGKTPGYGYGWGIDEVKGQPVIRHSGGIPGFLSTAIYFPEQGLLTVVLSNCTCNPPQEASRKIAEMAIEEYMEKE